MTLMKDRELKRSVTHRIACGRPANPMNDEKMAQSLLFFELTTMVQDQKTQQFQVDVEAVSRLKAFGDGVRYKNMMRIPIRFDSNNIEDFLTQQYESRATLPVLGPDGKQKMWPGKKKKVDGRWTQEEATPATQLQVWCSGDGKNAKRRKKDGSTDQLLCCSNPKKYPDRPPAELAQLLAGRAKHIDADGKRCPWSQNEDYRAGPLCKPTTLLVFRSDVVGNLGSFCRYRSTGHNTADELFSSILEIQRLLGGQLEHVPLDLVCSPRQIAKNNNKKLQPVVHVELRMGLDETFRLVDETLRNRASMLSAGAESPRGLLADAVREAKATVDAELDLTMGDGHRPGGNIPTPEVLPPEKT